MNNTFRPGRRVAWRDIGIDVQVQDNELWNRLRARYMKPRVEEPQVAVRDADELARLRKMYDTQDIVDAVNRAVTAAYKRHKERGESVVIWRDGKIVTLKPEEIDV